MDMVVVFTAEPPEFSIQSFLAESGKPFFGKHAMCKIDLVEQASIE